MEIPKQWPIKILLVHPNSPFLKRPKIIIAADCALLLRRDLHTDYEKGIPIFIGCPLLENPDLLFNKLRVILSETSAKQINIISMEVPCCHTLHMMVRKLLNELNVEDRKINHYIIRIFTGDMEEWRPGIIDESMIKLERIAHGH